MENSLVMKNNFTKKQIIAGIVITIVTMALMFFLICNGILDADVVSQVKGSFTDLASAVKSIANPIAIVAVIVCGIYMLAGSDPTTLRKVKSWLLAIVIGLVMINLAGPLVQWAESLAS